MQGTIDEMVLLKITLANLYTQIAYIEKSHFLGVILGAYFSGLIQFEIISIQMTIQYGNSIIGCLSWF